MQDEFLRLQAQLHKTIVFVTHDIDEAIRLADRIVIMKDGAVEQTGTAEEIVLHPATDYVRDFTRAVPAPACCGCDPSWRRRIPAASGEGLAAD